MLGSTGLSEDETLALNGIAYLRGFDVYDGPPKELALAALRENPHVLEKFRRVFPFVALPS